MKDELHLHRALKELQDYREIGTVEEFKDLKELRTAKKVDIWVNSVFDVHSYHCPNCEANLTGGFETYNFCVQCGQKIKM